MHLVLSTFFILKNFGNDEFNGGIPPNSVILEHHNIQSYPGLVYFYISKGISSNQEWKMIPDDPLCYQLPLLNILFKII